MGVGPGEPDGDEPGAVPSPEVSGVAEPDGVAERGDVAERLGSGVRVGLSDGTGLGVDGAGTGVGVLLTAGWGAATEAGVGRTRMYSANTARNATVRTMVEVRGRMASSWLRSRGRCRLRRGSLTRRPGGAGRVKVGGHVDALVAEGRRDPGT